MNQIYRVYREQVKTNFEGTIIDIETIGEIRRVGGFPPQGQDYLGKYKNMKITTVGIFSDNELCICIAKSEESIDTFQKKAIGIMKNALTPTYAFYKSFEEGCFFWNSEKKFFHIDGELQSYAGEKKEKIVRELVISSYDDPFHGEGWRCVSAFFKGNIDDIIRHNRACLLKEKQILEKRGAKKIKTMWMDFED